MRIRHGFSRRPLVTFLFAAMSLAVPVAAFADASCRAVGAAYQKMLSSAASQNAKNSGTVNVTNAFATITSSGYDESCKLLREENINGEAAQVYSDEFKSKAGQAHGTVWISKSSGLTLRQDVDVDMGATGKGHQTITFEYKKK